MFISDNLYNILQRTEETYEGEEMSIPGYVCEVCGKPAVIGIGDSKQLPPKEDDQYYHMAPDGPVHFFCMEHKRDSRVTYIPGWEPREEAEVKKDE